MEKVISFSAGPSSVPEQVKIDAKEEFLNYAGVGISLMEMSHRSPEFTKIIEEAEKDLRDILRIPDNYKVIFLQGGGTGQFSAVPMNLCPKDKSVTNYIVTGAWSDKAAKEAGKHCQVNRVTPKPASYTGVPDKSQWKINQDAEYFYYCDNETIHGVEFNNIPEVGGATLVCDMSSNILTRPVDVSKYGLIYAGAQKNMGIAGVTVVIIREDLIGKAKSYCPSVLDYKINADNKSVYNTPATFCVYILGKVLKWVKKEGGVEEMSRRCSKKSGLIYNLIDSSNGFYYSPVDKDVRSRVTIPFRVGGGKDGNTDLETKFIAEAKKKKMISLKGHRSVGGIRASVFNAISIEETEKLVNFMKEFQAQHQ